MKQTPYHHMLVAGLGVSGLAAAELLLGKGCAVTVVDADQHGIIEQRQRHLETAGVRVLTACQRVPEERFDLAVMSPGISPQSPLFEGIRHRGIPMISELELGWQHLQTRVLAVTGSNGKSTVAKCLYEILREAGMEVSLGGNYGEPVCSLAKRGQRGGWTVLEVSSFQLQTVQQFRPDIGILTTIQPNHLDWHRDMQDYSAAKWRLFEKMRPEDVCIIPHAFISNVKPGPRCITFGIEEGTYRYKKACICSETEPLLSIDGSMFDNAVMGCSAAAVTAAADCLQINRALVADVLRHFERLPHRMQPVAEQNGIRFVNDSKATSLSAMAAALHMTGGHARLLAGGLLKETNLTLCLDALRGFADKIYLYGDAAESLQKAWGQNVPCANCMTLERAAESAWRDAQPGDTILLSPGCASFDQFGSYAERGTYFVNVVKRLAKEVKA